MPPREQSKHRHNILMINTIIVSLLALRVAIYLDIVSSDPAYVAGFVSGEGGYDALWNFGQVFWVDLIGMMLLMSLSWRVHLTLERLGLNWYS